MIKRPASGRLCNALFVARPAMYVLALVFFAYAARHAVQLSFLHDEGLFSYDIACAARGDFMTMLFVMKAKPLLVALYTVPAIAGVRVFLVLHAAVAASGIILVSEAARSLGARWPGLAGWALAASIPIRIS